MTKHILSKIPIIYNDGGRAKAGYKKIDARDCGVRASAIALGIPYKQAYDELTAIVRQRKGKREYKIISPSQGVYSRHMQKLMAYHGWVYCGFECGELPLIAEFVPPISQDGSSRVVVWTKQHYFAIINGERHDTHALERTGKVIGYWFKP